MTRKKFIKIGYQSLVPGLDLCAGCPHLTLGAGWSCFYKKDTAKCAYPDKVLERQANISVDTETTKALIRFLVKVEAVFGPNIKLVVSPDDGSGVITDIQGEIIYGFDSIYEVIPGGGE